MEPEAAKLIGAGIACIALAGAGIGIGTIFGNYLSGALRNPSAAQSQFPNLLFYLFFKKFINYASIRFFYIYTSNFLAIC